LRAFALLEREEIADERDPAITIEAIRLHRLVRAVAGARYIGAARKAVTDSLIEAMAEVYPDGAWAMRQTLGLVHGVSMRGT